MDLKSTLRALTLELRHELEGRYDAKGNWQPGDLERRLASLGVRRDRPPVPIDQLPHLSVDDRAGRRVVDAFVESRTEAGESRDSAIAEFVRESAYTWANRLLALRCMEARGLIDEVILQKEAYGGRSLQHQRLARKDPERCSGPDEGLTSVLLEEFVRRAEELPVLFDPRAPEVALRPSIAALKRCIALLSGTLAVKGQEPASEGLFTAPDALGWAYQYWNVEEKERVDDWLKTRKGFKCEGYDIVYKTGLYTEPYIVRFLVQNSLGSTWMAMHPDSRLFETWELYVRGAHPAPSTRKTVAEITFLDPACGSGHFLIEAFDLLYSMYVEEGVVASPEKICASILEHNLYGIDIDERAVQIAALALVMKAKEKAPDYVPRGVNVVATNIRLPSSKDHLDIFLAKHPEDAPLKPALLVILESLSHADELGSLLQIEEPVDRELRQLREQQLARERKAGAGMLFGPRKDEEWTAWKHEAIERVRDHFRTETRNVDLSGAFFGAAAIKGLSLVDLLTRRYDIVATNPPYMGAGSMGALLKAYVERHFAPGKRDLYAAFILRCIELAVPGGRVAMVTQHSWMFLRSFEKLRAPSSTKSEVSFRGLLLDTQLETLAHLGPHAFSEISGEVVSVALFTLQKSPSDARSRFVAIRALAHDSSVAKASEMAAAATDVGRASRYAPRQWSFLALPGTPIVYWLPVALLDWMPNARRLSDFAIATDGVTGLARLTRFIWETGLTPRWRLYSKGGSHVRWAGQEIYTTDWEHEGARQRAYIDTNYPYLRGNYGFRLKEPGIFPPQVFLFSSFGRGGLGCRVPSTDVLVGDKGPGLVPRSDAPESLLALLNHRGLNYVVRAIGGEGQVQYPYLPDMPIPDLELDVAADLQRLTTACVESKRKLVAQDPTEYSFLPPELSEDGLQKATRAQAAIEDEHALSLAVADGASESRIFAAYLVDPGTLDQIFSETGAPAAWLPMLRGYDSLPAFLGHLPSVPFRALGATRFLDLSADQLSALKQRVRVLYEARPEVAPSEDEPQQPLEEETVGESAAPVSRSPVPAETLLEDLSQQLQTHPVSVYWLLRELREAPNARCHSLELRFAEDYLSVLTLRLIGHQWPLERSAGLPPPAWADQDGVIPVTEFRGEPTLIARVRERIEVDFGHANAGRVVRELEDTLGESLGTWLSVEFFKRHISQFRKRPVVWQLASSRLGSAGRGGRGSTRKTPAFQCLVYYQRLDADLLPKLRAHYVGPLAAGLQTELAGIEVVQNRTADQDSRRLELEKMLDELRGFDAQLQAVVTQGFASTALDKIIEREPLDAWTSRDGRNQEPETQVTLLAQERRYDPDLNDGVRLNIAPLQRAGLLAVDVLAGKDVEKAIANRAEWRADERRWCREGRLPRPGWWPPSGEEGS